MYINNNMFFRLNARIITNKLLLLCIVEKTKKDYIIIILLLQASFSLQAYIPKFVVFKYLLKLEFIIILKITEIPKLSFWYVRHLVFVEFLYNVTKDYFVPSALSCRMRVCESRHFSLESVVYFFIIIFFFIQKKFIIRCSGKRRTVLICFLLYCRPKRTRQYDAVESGKFTSP